jgi:diguanylate cyclase (GGDEF)-like protein
VLHLTTAWMLVSATIYVPMIVGAPAARPAMMRMSDPQLATAAVVFCYAFLVYHRWLQPRVDQLFGRGRWAAESAVQSFVTNLRSLGELADLAKQLSEVTKLFHPQWTALYRYDTRLGIYVRMSANGVEQPEQLAGRSEGMASLIAFGEPIERSAAASQPPTPQAAVFGLVAAEVACPLAVAGRPIGLMLLGPKTNRRPYDEVDLKLLTAITSAAAIAISNAIAYADAVTDNLTGLHNRRFVEEGLERLLHEARRHSERAAVFLIDLDHFKALNDNHGHAVGDLALCAAADRIREAMRAGDIIGRLGGDEFLVVAPRINDIDPTVIANRIARKIAGTPIEIGERQVSIGASVGAATFPENGETAKALMLAADAAMYARKRAGRLVSEESRVVGEAE